MDKNFCLGLILGMLAGSVACANSKKLRDKIIKTQTKVISKFSQSKEDKNKND